MPDPLQVYGAVYDIPLAPPLTFTVDYFSTPAFPVNAFRRIDGLYGFYEIPQYFFCGLFLRDHEVTHKSIMNQGGFAIVLGLNPRSTRSVIDKFQQARVVSSRRTSVTEPRSIANSIEELTKRVEKAPAFPTTHPLSAHVPP